MNIFIILLLIMITESVLNPQILIIFAIGYAGYWVAFHTYESNKSKTWINYRVLMFTGMSVFIQQRMINIGLLQRQHS